MLASLVCGTFFQEDFAKKNGLAKQKGLAKNKGLAKKKGLATIGQCKKNCYEHRLGTEMLIVMWQPMSGIRRPLDLPLLGRGDRGRLRKQSLPQ